MVSVSLMIMVMSITTVFNVNYINVKSEKLHKVIMERHEATNEGLTILIYFFMYSLLDEGY